MSELRVDVSGSGAVSLGDNIVCDGFRLGCPTRVQTHVHDDHMTHFEESKGYQTLYMSPGTKRLIEVEYNADISIRSNIKSVEMGDTIEVNDDKVRLISSGHMLGAVQVEVELADGARVGYSGDFGWPLDDVIQVNQLVVDSTYGSPDSIRDYSRAQVEEQLIALVRSRLDFGPVHIKAHRGTLHGALEMLSKEFNCPFIASQHRCVEIDVYRQLGYSINDLLVKGTPEAKKLEKTPCILIYSKGDRLSMDYHGTSIVLSAFSVRGNDPVLEYSDRSWRVALSDHADYGETLQYVEATGAESVLVDNYRGGHAVELALAIERELGVTAMPSACKPSRDWGA